MPIMGMLRIMMVVSGYPPRKAAGMERGCQRLAEALAGEGHTIGVITMGDPELPARREENGVVVHRVLRPLALGPLWGATYMGQVARHLVQTQRQWDVVLCHKVDLHSAVANAVARWLGRRAVHLMVNAGEYGDLRRLAAHRGGQTLLRRALAGDGYLALSATCEEELAAAGVPSVRIAPWRYFVDTLRFAPNPAEPPADPPEFLFLGRFHRQKNLPLLLDAFRRAAGEHPTVRLRLIGRGPEDAAVRALAAASPASASISIDNWIDAPEIALRRASVVVSSSDGEGLSNTLIEAMACGTPVIATDVSGAREALGLEGAAAPPTGGFVVGSGGLLVPPRDAEALAGAMARLVADPELRRRLAGEARARALSCFSREAGLRMFNASMQKLLGAPSQP